MLDRDMATDIYCPTCRQITVQVQWLTAIHTRSQVGRRWQAVENRQPYDLQGRCYSAAVNSCQMSPTLLDFLTFEEAPNMDFFLSEISRFFKISGENFIGQNMEGDKYNTFTSWTWFIGFNLVLSPALRSVSRAASKIFRTLHVCGGGLGAAGREKSLYVLFERDDSQAGGLFHLFPLSFYF